MDPPLSSNDELSVQELVSSSIKILKMWYRQLSSESHAVLRTAAEQIVEFIEAKCAEYQAELELHNILVTEKHTRLVRHDVFVPFHFMEVVAEKFAHYSFVKAEYGRLKQEQQRQKSQQSRGRRKQLLLPINKRKRSDDAEHFNTIESSEQRIRHDFTHHKKARIATLNDLAVVVALERSITSDIENDDVFGDFDALRSDNTHSVRLGVISESGIPIITPAKTPYSRKSRKSLRSKRSQTASPVTETEWARVAEEFGSVMLGTPANKRHTQLRRSTSDSFSTQDSHDSSDDHGS